MWIERRGDKCLSAARTRQGFLPHPMLIGPCLDLGLVPRGGYGTMRGQGNTSEVESWSRRYRLTPR